MQCSVRWTGEGMSFIAETGSGHLVTMDGAPDGGGRNLAPRPMEMLLVGTGGCAAYDVVLILQRGRHAVQGCTVELDSRARDRRSESVHAHRNAIYGPRQSVESRSGAARGAAVARKILFGDRHAGQDRRDHTLGEDRRRRLGKLCKKSRGCVEERRRTRQYVSTAGARPVRAGALQSFLDVVRGLGHQTRGESHRPARG